MSSGAPATVGRNDPCPCGSGKKYKKCCIDKGGSTPDATAPVAAPAGGPARDLLEQAKALHRAGRVEMAIDLYRQQIAQKPKDASAFFFLGQALGQVGTRVSRSEGIKMLRQAIALNAKRSRYHANLAALLLKNGDADASLRSAERAIALDPADVVSHCTAAACHERMNRLDAATAAVERALKVAPTDPDASPG